MITKNKNGKCFFNTDITSRVPIFCIKWAVTFTLVLKRVNASFCGDKENEANNSEVYAAYTAYPFKAILILLDGILKLLGKGEWTSNNPVLENV